MTVTDLRSVITTRNVIVITFGTNNFNKWSINCAHSFIGVYTVMHHGTLPITWHVALTSSVVEGAAGDLRTLSLWKC